VIADVLQMLLLRTGMVLLRKMVLLQSVLVRLPMRLLRMVVNAAGGGSRPTYIRHIIFWLIFPS